MLHAFDDWKEGREEYPNDGKQLDFLKNLFDETYISDIVGRNNVRNKSELEEIKNGKKTLLLTKDGFKKIIITKDAIAPLYNEDGELFDFLLDEKSLEI